MNINMKSIFLYMFMVFLGVKVLFIIVLLSIVIVVFVGEKVDKIIDILFLLKVDIEYINGKVDIWVWDKF